MAKAVFKIFNMVTDADNDRCPKGELLTDKELGRLFKRAPWRKPNTIKVKVDKHNCYIDFGARFIIDGASYEKVV